MCRPDTRRRACVQLYWFKYVCSPGVHSCFGTEWYRTVCSFEKFNSWSQIIKKGWQLSLSLTLVEIHLLRKKGLFGRPHFSFFLSAIWQVEVLQVHILICRTIHQKTASDVSSPSFFHCHPQSMCSFQLFSTKTNDAGKAKKHVCILNVRIQSKQA